MSNIKISKLLIFIIPITIIILLFMASCMVVMVSTNMTPTETITETTTNPTTTLTAKSTKTPKNISYTFTSGNYYSGSDFEEGIYNIIAISGNGNVSSSNMFDGGINAIMGVDGGIYEKEYKNIEFPKDAKLTIESVTIQIKKVK